MSVGRRSMLAKLYRYQEGGSGGFMTSQYVPVLTPTGGALWWVRVVEGAGVEETLGEKARQVAPIVVAFSQEVTIDPRGAVRVAGITYRITGVSQKPQAYEQHISAVWAENDTFAVTS